MKECPKCKSSNFIRSGKVLEDRQRYKCKNCGRFFSTKKKKSTPSVNLIKKYYKIYAKSNEQLSTIYKYRNHYKLENSVSRTTVDKWLDIHYWESKGETDNDFYPCALNYSYFKDIGIVKFFESTGQKIRVRPLKNRVKIQYLFRGYKTHPIFIVDLFTISEIREEFGDVLCSVNFQFLTDYSRLRMYNRKLKSESADLIDFFSNETNNFENLSHIESKRKIEKRNTLRKGLLLSEFCDAVFSDTYHWDFIIEVAELKVKHIQYLLLKREELDRAIKCSRREKADRVKDLVRRGLWKGE